MSQDSTVDHLREERPLRNQLSQHPRYILLALRSKCLFVPRPPAERHDDRLLTSRQLHGAKRSESAQRSSRSRANSAAQKLTAIPALLCSELAQRRIQRSV